MYRAGPSGKRSGSYLMAGHAAAHNVHPHKTASQHLVLFSRRHRSLPGSRGCGRECVPPLCTTACNDDEVHEVHEVHEAHEVREAHWVHEVHPEVM